MFTLKRTPCSCEGRSTVQQYTLPARPLSRPRKAARSTVMTTALRPRTAPVGSGASIAEERNAFARYLARQRSPKTAEVYLSSLDQFTNFLSRTGMPQAVDAIAREHVEAWIEALQARVSPATVSVRYRALQSFWAWAVREDIVAASPMARTELPKVPEKLVPVLSSEQVRALFATCRSRAIFDDLRDTAILALLLDTGMRRAELAGLKLADVETNDHGGTAYVVGKGARPRIVPFSTTAADALDRYLNRLAGRKGHKYAGLPNLWIGQKGALHPNGILQLVRRRAAQAGLPRTFVHQFRHTAAHLMLSNGAQEGDVMQNLGWRSSAMLRRYGASAAGERARAAHSRTSPLDNLK